MKKIFFFISFLVFNSACTINASITSLNGTTSNSATQPATENPDTPPTTPTLKILNVDKTYPISGSRFFFYIKGNNGGDDLFSQPDVPCDGTESDAMASCIHGGDKLKVELSDTSSCTGLTVSDALGAFEWICKENPTQKTAIFYTTGFKSNKGLSDIIDFSLLDWKSNSVTLYSNGLAIGTSAPLKWWSNSMLSNPIVPLPSMATLLVINNSLYLPGTVLVANLNMDSVGININGNSIGIVTSSLATISYTGSVTNCNHIDGEVSGPTYKYLLCGGSQKYIWIEGNFKDASITTPNSDNIMGFIDSAYFKLNKITILKTSANESIYFSNSKNVIATTINLQNIWGSSLTFALYGSNYNQVLDFQASYASEVTYYEFLFTDGNYNVFSNIKTSVSTSCGIGIDGNNNIVTSAQSTDTRCLIRLGGTRNTASHVYSIFGGIYNVHIAGQKNTLNQALVTHGSTNLGIQGEDNVVSQAAIYTSANWNLGIVAEANNTKFTNNIVIHDDPTNSRCSVSGTATNAGTVQMTCGNQGSSNANWYYFPAVFTLDFLSGAATSDSVNTSTHTNGVALYSIITDWLNFESYFRTWSPVNGGAAFCNSSDCQFWDNRLKQNSTLYRNTSNDGQNQNEAFIAGAPCPAAVHGNKYLTDQMIPPNTFLINAQEVLNDGVGNDNGLCETGETCIYSPNFGAYQGEGDYKNNGTCSFQNGTIQNVKMYAYPINGI